MAVALATQSSVQSSATNASCTVTFGTHGPSGITSGDLLLAWDAATGGTGDITFGTTPTGWTKELEINDTGGDRIAGALYSKVSDGSESSVVFPALAASGSAANSRTAIVLRITGQKASGWLDASSTTAVDTSTPIVVTGVTTTVDNCLVIYLVAGHSTGVRTHTWATATEAWDGSADVSTGDASSNTGATLTQATAGATGTASSTASAAQNAVGACIAIAPAVAATGRRARMILTGVG